MGAGFSCETELMLVCIATTSLYTTNSTSSSYVLFNTIYMSIIGFVVIIFYDRFRVFTCFTTAINIACMSGRKISKKVLAYYYLEPIS